jgi:hypothetical protein
VLFIALTSGIARAVNIEAVLYEAYAKWDFDLKEELRFAVASFAMGD